MATVQCPTEIPVSHNHELLESKRHVPYVRCDGMGSHIYFKTDEAREWLAAHLVNGGTIENPSSKKDDFFSGEIQPEEARENPQDVGEKPMYCVTCFLREQALTPVEPGTTECSRGDPIKEWM